MKKDYHLHPQIMTKPEQFEQFVQAAKANGVEELCITDHMPLMGDDASDRIPHGKVAQYCRRVQQIQEEYRGIIRVKCGIEIDYYPTVLDQMEAVLREGEFDFVLGSSHLHVIDQLNGPSRVDIFANAKTHNGYAKAMFENTVAAIKSGYFNAISHIDMHRWIFANPDRFPLRDDGYAEQLHKERIEKVLEAIKEKGLRLEINPHFAIGTGKPENLYPNVPIVKMALEKGVLFSFGSDAHTAEDVGGMLDYLRQHEVYAQALKTWEEDV